MSSQSTVRSSAKALAEAKALGLGRDSEADTEDRLWPVLEAMYRAHPDLAQAVAAHPDASRPESQLTALGYRILGHLTVAIDRLPSLEETKLGDVAGEFQQAADLLYAYDTVLSLLVDEEVSFGPIKNSEFPQLILVTRLRRLNVSWGDIAAQLGINKASTYKKFRALVDRMLGDA